MRVTRLGNNPIIYPDMDARIGTNINGPSLIAVPPWVDAPLGYYYLYFSHHKGKYIRLAYANSLEGLWHVYRPGFLDLNNSLFPSDAPSPDALPETYRRTMKEWGLKLDLFPHIASPDVHVNLEHKQIRMYFHGCLGDGTQATRVAISKDGLEFTSLEDVIARSYLRVFLWKGSYYGMAMPGVFYRSKDGLTNFLEGPKLFNPKMRHAALYVKNDTLYVVWTQVGDAPERILLSRISLLEDWNSWQASEPTEVLRPETEWEGAHLPIEPSVRGAVLKPVNQLRDPAVFEYDGGLWLLYAVAGESGIAIAKLELNNK